MESPRLTARMRELNIDIPLTRRILKKINDPNRREPEPVIPRSIPGIDGLRVLDRRNRQAFRLPEKSFLERVEELDLPGALVDAVPRGEGEAVISRNHLERIGLFLLPGVSYGVFNGGSASSYADHKKNRAFSPNLFELYRRPFEGAAELCLGRAKGITPAFIHPDGTPGAAFMELKMRGLLIQILRRRAAGFPETETLQPLFQMTSVLNDTPIRRAFDEYAQGPLLEPLIRATGVEIHRVETGIQPLMAAFTPAKSGVKREVFSTAYGKTDEPLPLPGGHGQNFAVLREIYRGLHRRGKRFVYLGNVDNLGNLPDPWGIAILALGGKEAAFDFAFKTPVDVKGGILVEDQRGRLNCADMGVAIPKEAVEQREREGAPILFNCATGLFNLDGLVSKLDRIIADLPLRISIQDKDPGRYAQAEQATWEVLGLLEDFFVYGVEKGNRFLASKLLLENLLTSGLALDHPDFPRHADPAKDLWSQGRELNGGLRRKLSGPLGMELKGQRWEPLPPDRLGA